MKINLQDLTTKIEQEDYLQDLETAKYAEISKSKSKIEAYAKKMVEQTATAIKHDSLSQIALEVTGQRPVRFSLETNLINLPYSNYKKVANFFNEDEEYPVLVYFETASDYLNASNFRIDQLATQEELNQNPNEVIAKLTAEISAKLKQVREYQKPAAPAKKTTTKKVTKTSNKKSTTKKGKQTKAKKS
ncbi:hypothetical protein OZX56_01185 [Lactobacillus sp. ESL0684]|uniref:hypothetical protein n=1 Tax=unclassified Lactobacillus TaxID=2620435 RepID=UPI0023F6A4E6|nr:MULTISPECIES: hypothetical protein [unclassified Lactobacillus]WEV39599.1 hypothetical protein OZX59_05120 [Lactobacillus sp. ESL0681]WEV43881.1 hypothetical protein OZX56_01185 [Lactobacillus sp. ESL0684]